jgi:hypothetical protein
MEIECVLLCREYPYDVMQLTLLGLIQVEEETKERTRTGVGLKNGVSYRIKLKYPSKTEQTWICT